VWIRSAADESAVAVSFVPAGQENHFRLIEKRQGQRVPREVIAGFEPAGSIGP
jgi:ATP-dependent RNA helicase RhlE